MQVAREEKKKNNEYHVYSIGNTGYTYILKEDGTVSSLGYNANGELGNGAQTSTTAVQEVSNLTEIIQVAGSKDGNFGVAVKEDGTVWTWGNNANGELGRGDKNSVYSPVQVKSGDGNSYLTDIIFVSAGSNHTLALRKDGTVWAWGINSYGQLGNKTTTGT